MTALITLSHGSRHPRALAGITALTRAAAARLGVPGYAAHLEFNAPDLPTLAAQLADAGHTDAIVVPLLFTRGFHHTHDVPRAVTAAGAHLNVQLAPGLGTGADLAHLLATQDPDLLYSVGSSDPAATATMHALAVDVAERIGKPCRMVFATKGGADVVKRCPGAKIAPVFVTHGVLLDALPTPVAPLGTRLAPLVADRYMQVQSQGALCVPS